VCRASVFRGNRAGSAAHYFVGAGAARHRDLEGTRRQDGCLRERLPVWIYELKFDGYRALAFKDGKNVRLVSPNKKALSGALKVYRGSKEDLLRVAQDFGLEALVAKRKNSLYESGRRSGAWVKFKITKSQEFVIGGYTPPEGSRKYFGSLIVGYQSPRGLLFAGRVGTGFSERVLADLYAGMQKLKRTTCSFVNLPEKKRGRWTQSLTPAIMKRCSWVEPGIGRPSQVHGVDARWQLRQPVFLGLRTGKEAKDVVRK
jgi:ATP-dependent DNA ligase